MSVIVSPSLLSADFCNLESEIKALEKAGADCLHIDVMDGVFVPNITIGIPVVKAIKKITKLPLDVHLMIINPSSYIKDFAEAGADVITIHYEAENHLDRAIELIKQHGKKAGVSLCPATNEMALKYILPKLDHVLVMTVNPGFGGQSFLESQLDKITSIGNMINKTGRDISLAVDGGINDKTAKKVIQHGANFLISGNYVFNGDYTKNIRSLRG